MARGVQFGLLACDHIRSYVAVPNVDGAELTIETEHDGPDAIVIWFTNCFKPDQHVHARTKLDGTVTLVDVKAVPEDPRRQYRKVAVASCLFLLTGGWAWQQQTIQHLANIVALERLLIDGIQFGRSRRVGAADERLCPEWFRETSGWSAKFAVQELDHTFGQVNGLGIVFELCRRYPGSDQV